MHLTFHQQGLSIIAAGLLCVASAAAQETGLKVAGYQNEILLPPDGTGPYSKVIDLIAERSGVPIRLQILPAKRAWRAMHGPEPDVDCDYPSALDHRAADGLDTTAFLQSEAISHVRVYAVTGKDRPTVRTVRDLQGLRVAFNRGYGYGPDLAPVLKGSGPVRVQLYPVNNDLQGLRMLLLYGRVDVMLSYYPELLSFIRANDLPRPAYDLHHPLWQVPDALVCHGTAAVADMLNRVNDAIRALQQEGAIQSILGPLYLPVIEN